MDEGKFTREEILRDGEALKFSDEEVKIATLVKSSSVKVAITLLSIWLFVFIGHSETLGAKPIYSCENLRASRYFYQPSIVDASKNFFRGWIESVYKEASTIEIGARLGLRKCCSKSEGMPIILCVFIAVWGTSIIFVLGLILYQVVIESLVRKKLKLKRE